MPAWTLWLLRFQIGLPYLFGGLAKFGDDWLRGQPMQMWLSISVWRVLFGPVAQEQWLALIFSWGGLVFDLCIVPLLVWRRTRAVAFVVAVLFHLMNAFMFDIGVFPWVMIGATTVFCDPDWPRRLITPKTKRPAAATSPVPKGKAVSGAAAGARVAPSRLQAALVSRSSASSLSCPCGHGSTPATSSGPRRATFFPGT